MRQSYHYLASAEAYARAHPARPRGYEGPGLYNRRTGYMMDQGQDDSVICAPYVCSDTPDYVSPCTDASGRHPVISGRAARREDLKRNNCFEMDPPKTMHRYVSSKYARTLKQRQTRRPKLVLPEDRVLNDKLQAVYNGARGI